MSTKTKVIEKNGGSKSTLPSVWVRAFASNSEWPDKVGIGQLLFKYTFFNETFFQEEFLDVIYWARQALGVILGIVWGLLPLKGFLGLML